MEETQYAVTCTESHREKTPETTSKQVSDNMCGSANKNPKQLQFKKVRAFSSACS